MPYTPTTIRSRAFSLTAKADALANDHALAAAVLAREPTDAEVEAIGKIILARLGWRKGREATSR